ncbi:MAG TPA: hypothetical protein VEH02_05205 [Pseudolabrys sp.]|nr:hypothetical protein [Pseudolabrys sp.]
MHGLTIQGAELALAAKVDFLSRPDAYEPRPASVVRRETHMSWVFLAGNEVYKLKKPVRFPYLDFSTLERRETACRAELRLNRRLAPDVYIGVVPLVERAGRLSIGGEGATVDWLVKMKRLDERFMLDAIVESGTLTIGQLDRLVETLTLFYRSATPVNLPPAIHLADWTRSLDYNKRVLLDPRFRVPSGLIHQLDMAQRRFLKTCGGRIAARLRHRRIVDGHGDLRPEHIWLDDRVRIIDCLEFNARLRINDPLDEIAFLALECERLGAKWAGDYLRRRMTHILRDGPTEELFTFYYCHRAMLRARLAIAHLLEARPRTPEKWPRLCASYLSLAKKSARRLEMVRLTAR